jgi:hypothetical protein
VARLPPEDLAKALKQFEKAFTDGGFGKLVERQTGRDGVALGRALLESKTPDEVRARLAELNVVAPGWRHPNNPHAATTVVVAPAQERTLRHEPRRGARAGSKAQDALTHSVTDGPPGVQVALTVWNCPSCGACPRAEDTDCGLTVHFVALLPVGAWISSTDTSLETTHPLAHLLLRMFTMRRLMPLLLVGAGTAWSNPNGITGYSGKSPGVTCSQCHTNQSGALVTATITGPLTLTPGQRASYVLRLTGRTSGRAGANLASVPGIVLEPSSSQLDDRLSELVHRSPANFNDPAFGDGGVTFPFSVRANLDAGTCASVYAAGQWVGGSGVAGAAQVRTTSFQVCVVAPNTPPVLAFAPDAGLLDGGASARVAVTATDDAPASELVFTWSSRDAGVSFAPNGTNAAQVATATFPRAGAFTLDVRVTDAQGAAATGSVSLTVGQQLKAVQLTPPSATISFGSTQAFGASARDQFGQPMATQPAFAWAVSDAGTISDAGVFSAGTRAASGTVTATGQGVVGRGTVTVAAGTPPTLSQPTASLQGKTVTLGTVGTDDTGEGGLSYTWSVDGPAPVAFSANGTNAAKATTATLTQAGTYVFTARARDVSGFTATASVTCTATPQLNSLVINPPQVTLMPGANLQFTLVQRDQFNQPMPAPAEVAWAAFGSGSISSTGLYMAGATLGGPFQVRATVGSLSRAADVTVSSGGAPVFTREATAQPALVVGRTTQLRAQADDASGPAGLTYTWSAQGPAPVSFTANGTTAARATQATFASVGRHTLTVTAQNAQAGAAASSVEVEVAPSAETLEVLPRRVWLAPGQSRSFSVRAFDQFGGAMDVGEATWRAPRGGTIDESGLFIAGGDDGSFEVTADLSGRFGTATVDVDGTPPIATLTGLKARSTIRGDVKLSAEVVEAGELVAVTFLVDGEVVGQRSRPPFSVIWDSSTVLDRRISVEVQAIDAAGNISPGETLEVGVWNDTTSPSPYEFKGGCGAAPGLTPFILFALALRRRASSRPGGRS